MPPKNTGRGLISGRPGHRPVPIRPLRRRMSLKTIGRKKICFHLDQLVWLVKEGDEDYSFSCRLVEPSAAVFGTGVMCSEMESGFKTQIEAEEAALEHIQVFHGAMGGQHRNSGSRRANTRQRTIDQSTARRQAREMEHSQNGEHEYFD